MTLQQIKYIISIANFRNFTVAAKKCNVNQSTITIQVKKLEEEIGLKIFDRSTTPLSITEKGEQLIEKGKNILMEVDQMKELVKEEKQGLEGKFNLGIIPTLSQYIIPEFSGDFTQKNPHTILNIKEQESEEIISNIKNGTLDIGILVTPINDKKIKEIKMFNEPFAFYGSKSNPLVNEKEINLIDIKGLTNLWLLKDGHCLKNQILNICNKEEKQRPVQFESGSIETLKQMVKKYGGYTLVPEMSINKLDTDNVSYFKKPKPVREISLIVHTNFAKEKLIDNIRKSILDSIPNHYKKNERYIRVEWR